MSFLITGATGVIGGQVARQLIAQGGEVRTISRNPEKANLPQGIKIFSGDLTASELPREVFDGVKSIFLFPVDGKITNFLATAKNSGVEHIVVLSSLAAAAEFPRDLNSTSYRHHIAIENAVREIGIDFTILRPGTFANNLRGWAYSIKTKKMVFGPYPESAQALIHEADIADVAVTALTANGHKGAIYPLTGPEALTQFQQLKTISDAIGQDLTFQKISPEQFKKSMSQFMSDDIIKMLLDYWSDTVKKPDVVRSTIEQITGQPARTLAQWAADHVSDFR